MSNTQEILDLARRDIAARRAATESARSNRPWLLAFVALSGTVLLGLLLLPIQGLDYRLQMLVHGVCSQAHYLDIGALRMPLCARNTGMYAGTMGTLLFLLIVGRGRAAKLPPLAITGLIMAGAFAMVLDGLNSMALDIGNYHLYRPHNELRVITGLLMGTAIGSFMLLMFNIALRREPRHDQPVIGSWLEYSALLLVNCVMYLLIFFGPPVLYYPLAILSVAGIVGVLFIANLFVMSMVGGMEGRVVRLSQLARPAAIAVVLTGLELTALAALRTWAERSMTMPM